MLAVYSVEMSSEVYHTSPNIKNPQRFSVSVLLVVPLMIVTDSEATAHLQIILLHLRGFS